MIIDPMDFQNAFNEAVECMKNTCVIEKHMFIFIV